MSARKYIGRRLESSRRFTLRYVFQSVFLLAFASLTWQGCATNYHAPYRFIGSSSEESHEGIAPEMYAGVESPVEDEIGAPAPYVLPSIDHAPLASYPSESHGLPDEELSTRCALSRVLEGKIEAGVALAIFLLVPNHYLKAVVLTAAPFVEDKILDAVDWLFEKPSP